MAIEVKHGADPAAMAAVGMGAGQGATRTRIRSAMLSATEQRVREERAREFSAEQSQISRDFSSEQSQIGREHQSDVLQSRMQYPSDFKFTSQQKSEFDRLNESYEEARRSGDFSDSELKELRRQIIAKQAGIKPLPTLEDGSKDPWTLAQARIFTDPGTGRQGYLDKDGVPQFYDKKSEGGANRQEFLKRYDTVKKDLTKPKFKKDVDGKMIEDGEEIPDANTILKSLQEQDKAWEMYENGQGGEQGGEIAAHVADPAQQTSRGAPPNPAMRRRMAEIAELGQDPDAPGGYSDRKVSNGKYIPKYLEGFITNEGIDQKAILEAAKLKAGASGGAITEEDVVAAITAELNELAKPPRKR